MFMRWTWLKVEVKKKAGWDDDGMEWKCEEKKVLTVSWGVMMICLPQQTTFLIYLDFIYFVLRHKTSKDSSFRFRHNSESDDWDHSTNHHQDINDFIHIIDSSIWRHLTVILSLSLSGQDRTGRADLNSNHFQSSLLKIDHQVWTALYLRSIDGQLQTSSNLIVHQVFINRLLDANVFSSRLQFISLSRALIIIPNQFTQKMDASWHHTSYEVFSSPSFASNHPFGWLAIRCPVSLIKHSTNNTDTAILSKPRRVVNSSGVEYQRQLTNRPLSKLSHHSQLAWLAVCSLLSLQVMSRHDLVVRKAGMVVSFYPALIPSWSYL